MAAAVPPLPDDLSLLDDGRLAGHLEACREAERAIRAEMAPFEARLQEWRQRQDRLRTEERRRQRQRQIADRQAVRTAVRAGSAPSIEEALAAPEPLFPGEAPFKAFRFLLETGGELALGYPGAREPALQMTDGTGTERVTTLARARALYAAGWECGVPQRPGVRVHTPGTRLERLLAPDHCFLELRAP